MKKWILSVALLVCFGGLVPQVKAQEIDELKNQLAQQEKLLQQMQQQLEQMEASQKDLEDQSSQMPENLKWAESLKWSGDFRYRHESIDDETKTEQRDRNRIRARLKVSAKVNDQWDAIFRLASGSSDSPTSTNQTLGDSDSDSFSSKEVWLDQAYVNYHPDTLSGFGLLMGKMSNPFYKAGKNQLIFDGDLSPEGGSANYQWGLNEATSATVTGGAFWLSERSTDADTSIFGVQGMLEHDLSDNSHLVGGVSYYDFGNIQDQALTGIGSKGNTTAAGEYVNDYDVFEGFGEFGFKMDDVPVKVFGSYVVNTAASTSGDTAWILGAKYNKAKNPNTWEVSYNYRDVEKDAVVGGLNDSDFIGGGTDGTGHVMGFKYQLAKNVQTGLKYFVNEKNASSTEEDYQLLQADFIFKF